MRSRETDQTAEKRVHPSKKLMFKLNIFSLLSPDFFQQCARRMKTQSFEKWLWDGRRKSRAFVQTSKSSSEICMAKGGEAEQLITLIHESFICITKEVTYWLSWVLRHFVEPTGIFLTTLNSHFSGTFCSVKSPQKRNLHLCLHLEVAFRTSFHQEFQRP